MSEIRLALACDFTLASKLLEALSESNLSFSNISAVELEPFGEEHALYLGSKAIKQIPLEEVNWADFSHILFAGKLQQADILAQAMQAGCIVLDLFGITASLNSVPVIVPSVNDQQLNQLDEQKVIALANPQISQLALTLKPFLNQPIHEIFVTSLLPMAYFGEEKVKDLAGQTARLLNGIPFDKEAERVAFDTVPISRQAVKNVPFSADIEGQLTKIFPNLTASTQFHTVQVPVFYGLSQMISLTSSEAFETTTIRQQWQCDKWLNFNEDKILTPVKNGENEEENRLQISQLINSSDNVIQYWTVADEQKFSLAFLAVQLLKQVLNQRDEIDQ